MSGSRAPSALHPQEVKNEDRPYTKRISENDGHGSGHCRRLDRRPATACSPQPRLEKERPSFRPSVWLRVLPDNTVVVTVNKSEMGQGVYTSLPMIVADELDADWKNVKMEVAPAGDAYKDPAWGMQATGGSSSIRHMYEPLRKAGAAAREMLVMARPRSGRCRSRSAQPISARSGTRRATKRSLTASS